MKCPHCQKDNKRVTLTCMYCGRGLQTLKEEDKFINQQKLMEVKARRKESDKAAKVGCSVASILLIIILIPIFYMGFSFLTIGLGESSLEKKDISKYKETTGSITKYQNCTLTAQKKEKCKAVYEFEVENKKYLATTSIPLEKDKFEKTSKVKYNPEKPEENNVSLKMPSYIIIGSIIIVSVIIIAIVLIVSYIKFVRSMRMAERSNS